MPPVKASSVQDAVVRLVEIMAALRDPNTGCPWDLAQSHRTLAPFALEEAYEVVEAIERGDPDDLCDELGDLLFQVVFHARVAQEAGAFAFDDVAEAISAKMLRRHPHVFARPDVSRPDVFVRPVLEAGAIPKGGAENKSWEAIKAAERAARGLRADGQGALAGVPSALPALTRALKLQRKAAAVGFDWGNARLVLAKIREEIEEIEHELDGEPDALAGEIGDLLFAVVNLARHAGVDPETATRATNRKFERRFAFIERELAARGQTAQAATLLEMDALWDLAKQRGL